ncbi:MAG: hypothetical protein KBE03_09105 [Leptotrichiaceae bacterium]|nr:hypothetical protein [Leptotrichiaceae bacterium]
MKKGFAIYMLITIMLGFKVYSQEVTPYKINSIKSYLFYEETGSFSQETSNFQALWNTPIGEGDTGGASNQVLVVIEVSGTPETYENRNIEFTAIEGNKVILKRTENIGVIGENGKINIGFWLYNVGMKPIKITGKIIGQKSTSTLTKTIPFESGE